MKSRQTILLPALALAAALACAAGARAQKDEWQGKPFREWTEKEARQVLTESPWSRTVASSGPVVNFGGYGNNTPTPDKVYVARLRSALPVRQAILRLRQIKEKYDAMSDSDKAKFDEKNKPLVDCPACADNYVVSLVPPRSADTRSPTTEKMKLFVQLMDDRGQRRELVHFVPTKATGEEVVFFFPRFDERGQPLLTPSSKRLIFTIDTSSIGMDATIQRFEFDVSKMVADGKVIF
ncbi:MAG TPA: hypothetical protein VF588_15680 [Pyrinomonadaceae bacterium]|jgi:hypothetical protein